jgi:(p)ppGpp synthase/HD superfamily hydrolase
MRSRDEIKAFLKRMNRFDGSMVQKACEFATFAHEGQLDKSGQEYVQHPTRVANALDKQYNDAIITTIAFMHDVIEEGNMTTSDLMLYFPEVVWKCVDILTRRNSLGRDDYIKKIGENFITTKIKLADLEDNMSIVGNNLKSDKDYERYDRYQKEFNYLSSRLAEFRTTLAECEQDTETYANYFM